MLVIRAFTDASVRWKTETLCDSSSAMILTINNSIIEVSRETKFHENCTSNYGEMYAIFLAMNAIETFMNGSGLTKDDCIIEIISDSNLCVQSLNNWIYSWRKYMKDGKLYKKTGELVANQEIVQLAFKLLHRNNAKIYHINSHITPKNLSKSFDKFCNSYGLIPMEMFIKFTEYNEKVDKLAKSVFRE